MAADPTDGVSAAEDERRGASVEESHEAIWAAMPTITIRPAAQPRQLAARQPEVEDGEEPALEVRRWNVEEDSDSESSASSDPGDHEALIAPSSDSTGQGLDGAEDDVEELIELFAPATHQGLDDDLLLELPTVEEEQRRLQEVIGRREEVRAILARYAPQRQTEALGASPKAEDPPSDAAAAQERPSEVTSSSASAGPIGCSTSSSSQPEGAGRGSSVNATSKSAEAKSVLRSFGPPARVEPGEASAVLRGLGARFRESGVTVRPGAGTAAQMVRDLGQRLGEEFPPREAEVAAPASRSDAMGSSAMKYMQKEDQYAADCGEDGGIPSASVEWEQSTNTVLPNETASQAYDPAAGTSNSACTDLPRAAGSSVAEAGGRAQEVLPAATAWTHSKEKLANGLAADAALQEVLWQQFLAGDDRPVGGDFLPPPGAYYAEGSS